MGMVKTLNEYLNYNGDYDFYKNLIENAKQAIINFIELYIEDEIKDRDKFHL